LIELRTHGFDPQPRCAVGASVLRLDKAPLSQTLKHLESAVSQDMTFAGVAGDVAYFAIFVPVMMDGPTKSEFMQNTLFVL
jgi:hypothetical protein